MAAEIIHDLFAPLYSLACWQARSGFGGFMTMEFGNPSLAIREPRAPKASDSPAVAKLVARRHVTVRGEWHLWIHSCAWKVLTGGKRIGHSNLKGTSKRPTDRAADELNGQKLMQVTVNPHTSATVFEFDLGSRLETRTYDDDREQWMLFEPSGNVFVLREKGLYSHHPGNTRPDDVKWQPL